MNMIGSTPAQIAHAFFLAPALRLVLTFMALSFLGLSSLKSCFLSSLTLAFDPGLDVGPDLHGVLLSLDRMVGKVVYLAYSPPAQKRGEKKRESLGGWSTALLECKIAKLRGGRLFAVLLTPCERVT
jgi:hypothetical protein